MIKSERDANLALAASAAAVHIGAHALQPARGRGIYRVRDDYGTHRLCWTVRDALDWLAYCSPRALVQNILTGRVIARTF